MVILPENETNNTGNAEDVEDRLEKGTRECNLVSDAQADGS